MRLSHAPTPRLLPSAPQPRPIYDSSPPRLSHAHDSSPPRLNHAHIGRRLGSAPQQTPHTYPVSRGTPPAPPLASPPAPAQVRPCPFPHAQQDASVSGSLGLPGPDNFSAWGADKPQREAPEKQPATPHPTEQALQA
uniref:Uncharacterized protein n=1 Tax=Rangifer tarandus platyrhynchus TaxID=3082113 RepID=A0ACB0ELB9_RANTA|nr:unnamed protein product [Rangifer tarandus platyrhynchus]